MINMCSRLSVLGSLADLSGAIMRRAGVLEAVGLRDIDTCENDGQNQAAWSTLRER
jgi:hypothetical protein